MKIHRGGDVHRSGIMELNGRKGAGMKAVNYTSWLTNLHARKTGLPPPCTFHTYMRRETEQGIIPKEINHVSWYFEFF